MFQITALYAGIIGLMFTYASFHVSLGRISERTSRGDGGSDELAKRIRRQGNMAEYAPMTLILIAMAEAQGAPAYVLHASGIVLVATRAGHLFALGRAGQTRLKQFSMLVCYLLLLFLSLAVLGHALF